MPVKPDTAFIFTTTAICMIWTTVAPAQSNRCILNREYFSHGDIVKDYMCDSGQWKKIKTNTEAKQEPPTNDNAKTPTLPTRKVNNHRR